MINLKKLEDIPLGFSYPQIPRPIWASLLVYKEQILTIFRQNHQFYSDPYTSDITSGYITQDPSENAVWIALDKIGFSSLSIEAVKIFPDWLKDAKRFSAISEKQFKYSEGYALVDLSIYFLYILNFYVPYRSNLSNILAVNLMPDALGRTNYTVAEAEIGRYLRKITGWSGRVFYSVEEHFCEVARHLIDVIELDSGYNSTITPNNGLQFENECVQALIQDDYNVQITSRTGDFGADIIASKDGLSFAIQCKDQTKPVVIKAVQEVVSARGHYATDYAVLCVRGDFTDAAVGLASSTKTILCNLQNLRV